MKRTPYILSALAVCLTQTAAAQRASLQPLKPIGVGWNNAQWGWMSFVAFNENGTEVASDGATDPKDVSNDLSLWTFPEGRLIRKFPIKAGELSDDFKYYATANAIGDLTTGKELLSLGKDAFATFAFSHDSRYVAESPWSKAKGGPQIRVLELPTLKPVSTFSRVSPRTMAISPDGKMLAAGHWDVVVLWNLHTGKCLGLLRGFGRYVQGIAFSRYGSLLAAGTDTGSVQVWDVEHKKRISSVELDGGYPALAFNPDGSLVAVGVYGTGTVWLIATKTGKVLDHRKVSDLGCGSVAFSPDGRFLITPSTGGIVTWPYDSGGTIRVFRVTSSTNLRPDSAAPNIP
jgi:WD40 repeat protein